MSVSQIASTGDAAAELTTDCFRVARPQSALAMAEADAPPSPGAEVFLFQYVYSMDKRLWKSMCYRR